MKKIKKKDVVIVISGKDKGKKGEVIKVLPDEDKIIVSRVNIVKKHTRPTQTDPGGIKEIEKPIHISKVKLVCPKCNQPTRVGFKFLPDGNKVRYCKKCKEMIM
ncbi:MAG: 50S ribosomal protein L24 [Elusimicrobiota bacterium]|nr:50S ribosomal protein L24 [Elusimicrobiota bacterium]